MRTRGLAVAPGGSEGERAAAVSETSIARGVPADLAVLAHVIEGELHHDDHERWLESAVQGGLPAWEDCSGGGDSSGWGTGTAPEVEPTWMSRGGS